MWAFPSLAHPFVPSYNLVVPAVMLFNPNLLGFFGPAACSFLNDSVWSSGFLLYHLRAPVSHLFLLGHPWPIYFPWASLALFLTLHSRGLLLTHLGFLGRITLSLILEAHELAINPLLSLFALLRACCDSFSLFYIMYCPWVCYFSLQAPLGPFVSLRPICLFHGPTIHYSYRLGLMVFLSTY